jgi:methylglutaconyl-CoA hydratase
MPITAEAIAARRVSEEGQEGLRAFLEKRAPRWSVAAQSGSHTASDDKERRRP